MHHWKRRTAMLVVLLLLAAGVPVPAQSPRAPDAELAAGIELVREGDFEAAVLKLDTVVRRLLADSARQKEAAQAYVYLGVAFLELNQELVARGKFQQALGLDPQLRLDAREFSPEQIRIFESARVEARSPSPAPAASPRPRLSPSPGTAVAANEQEKKKKRSPVLWILGGAAVIGAGAAAAAGGGGGGAQPTTTSQPVSNTSSTTLGTQPPDTSSTTTQPGEPPPSTTTTTSTTQPGTPSTTAPPGTTLPPGSTTTTTSSTTTTTTSTTTTTMPVGCSTASVGPPNQPAYGSLGSGFCPVTASNSCNWTAAVVGNPNWVNLTSSSGTGDGQIQFSLGVYVGPPRQATIFLVQNTSASCTITQTTLFTDASPSAGALTWTSDLDLVGGQGQIVLDGSSVSFPPRGSHSGSLDATPGIHRIEATVVSADGKPGTWRFRLAGPVRPGTLRVIAGTVVMAGPEEVVFRLAGRPGERVLFAFRLR